MSENTWQYKVFAWCYTLLQSVVHGAAMAAATMPVFNAHGVQIDWRAFGEIALAGAVVSAVAYLQQSPLPQLITIKKPVEPPPPAAVIINQAELRHAELRQGEIKINETIQ